MHAKADTYIGKTCSRGHENAVRYVRNGACVRCATDASRERMRDKRKANPALQLLASAKQRASESGREFNLTIEDIIIPARCPVLNIEMTSPSLDRIDSSKGYVKGNVCVISWRANKLKQDATLNELRQLVAYVERMQD